MGLGMGSRLARVKPIKQHQARKNNYREDVVWERVHSTSAQFRSSQSARGTMLQANFGI
jgi:hypothetical protein